MTASKILVGVSGDLGSFSEEAGLLYTHKNNINASLRYLIDMKRVLKAVSEGEIEIGILPVMNMHGGLVKMAFEAMGNYAFTFVDYFWLDVHQCLQVLPGTERSQITKIYSHPQAFAQCKQYLKTQYPAVALIEWEDTAKAASDLVTGKLDASSAVIAPERCAFLYGLDLLAKNIQDHQPNMTAFIVVKRNLSCQPSSN